MHTLEQLQGKTFRELKKIGWELNVLPEGDRRRRETWIKAIAGVKRPLLQLLEVSPAAEVVEQAQEPIEVQAQEAPLESKFGRIVYPLPAQKSIEQAAENSPGVEVDLVQQPIIETVKTPPGVEVDQFRSRRSNQSLVASFIRGQSKRRSHQRPKSPLKPNRIRL